MLFRKSANVGGEIAYHDLTEWWLSVFTEEERRYIDEQYCPMGANPHSLTQGKFPKEEGKVIETGLFLNGLRTWFRKKNDESIYKRIREKIVELGNTRPINKIGYLRGRHYSTYVDDVKTLKQLGNLDDAESLLLEIVDIIEKVSKDDGYGVPPWYYEELAKIYRKNKDYEKEVAILDRFKGQEHGQGVKPMKLLERLEEAIILLNKEA